VSLERFLKEKQSSAKTGSWRPKKLVPFAKLPAPTDKSKPYELQLKKDGLWLLLNGQKRRAMINLGTGRKKQDIVNH
jgi:hypothetical protein